MVVALLRQILLPHSQILHYNQILNAINFKFCGTKHLFIGYERSLFCKAFMFLPCLKYCVFCVIYFISLFKLIQKPLAAKNKNESEDRQNISLPICPKISPE